MSAAHFDQIVVVDWSAGSSPKRGRDSIWIGLCEVDSSRSVTANVPTRREAFEHLRHLLASTAAAGRTTLVGLDFSFGYPSGFAELVDRSVPRAPTTAPWRRTWDVLGEMVHDGVDNENNRFAVADELNRRSETRLFWGRPKTPRFDGLRWLPPTDTVPEGLAPNPCPSLRLTELMAGRGIRSNFQLFGGVTVGGQVLTGIPWLAHLAGHLDCAAVWPFETGFVADPLEGGGPRARRVVFAELWPTLFGPPDQRGSVRDEGQVLTALDACAQLDGTGWASWFDPEAVRLLPAHRRREVLSEEGWILGVTAPSPPPA